MSLAGVLVTQEPSAPEAVEPAIAGDMLAMADDALAHPPVHVPYDAWGRRVDRIEVAAGSSCE